MASTWKGKGYIRSQPAVVGNPSTIQQNRLRQQIPFLRSRWKDIGVVDQEAWNALAAEAGSVSGQWADAQNPAYRGYFPAPRQNGVVSGWNLYCRCNLGRCALGDPQTDPGLGVLELIDGATNIAGGQVRVVDTPPLSINTNPPGVLEFTCAVDPADRTLDIAGVVGLGGIEPEAVPTNDLIDDETQVVEVGIVSGDPRYNTLLRAQGLGPGASLSREGVPAFVLLGVLTPFSAAPGPYMVAARVRTIYGRVGDWSTAVRLTIAGEDVV